MAGTSAGTAELQASEDETGKCLVRYKYCGNGQVPCSGKDWISEVMRPV